MGKGFVLIAGCQISYKTGRDLIPEIGGNNRTADQVVGLPGPEGGTWTSREYHP
jgi:hypothetical protein